jgi:hypothetical protein
MWKGCPVDVICYCGVSPLPDEMIRLINDGKVPLKARGDKKKALTEKLQEARRVQVTFTRSLKVKGVSAYKALSVDRYKETHQGKHPHDNGLTTVFHSLDGTMQEVVLVRQLPQGEWELHVEDATEIAKTEELANSETAIRESQLDDRLAQVKNTMTGAIGKAAICEDEFIETVETGSQAASDVDDGGTSEHDSLDDDGDDFMNVILGGESDQKGKKKGKLVAKSCAKPSVKGGKASPGRSGAAPSSGAPCRAQVPQTSPAKRTEPLSLEAAEVANRAKRSRTLRGQEVTEGQSDDAGKYLSVAGKDPLDQSLHGALAQLGAEIFDNSSERDPKVVQQMLKKVCDCLRKLHGDCISLQWKLKKRASPPLAALDDMQKFRDEVANIWTACLNFMNKTDCDLDTNKINSTLDSLKDTGSSFKLPLYLGAPPATLHLTLAPPYLYTSLKAVAFRRFKKGNLLFGHILGRSSNDE